LPPVADVFALRQGIVEVIVDETGAVKEATMRLSVNPVYDRLVLTAAKRWRYTPASLDGRPVKFRKIVQIDLKPNR
jgi:TonB family protein